MNALASQTAVVPNPSYAESRFNALQHGVLSRHVVLPWEDGADYRVLLDALVTEYAPKGPTEEHLVEELAGVIWRKGRLRLAEASIYRERLRGDATSAYEMDHTASAALLPVTGKGSAKASIPQAIAATPAETARDLREVKRDQATTLKAVNIAASGDPDAYARALAALADDTRSYWLDCLEERPKDGLRYEATAPALAAWMRRHWAEWYDGPISELQHRDVIREQAIGNAYATQNLEVVARYEVHLDRKLERTLAMLFRLREIRLSVVPG